MTPIIETVVKLGGGVLAHTEQFNAVLSAITVAAQDLRLLVVPGGGPFADSVRDVDRQFGLSDDAAHWMAVMAMDQYASLVVSRLANGVLVANPSDIAVALDEGRVPVLAPFRWLRDADPLPHSWDVTSDSIAAWVAGEVGASRLLLVKPPGATGDLVDAYFARALPASVSSSTVAANQIDILCAELRKSRTF